MNTPSPFKTKPLLHWIRRSYFRIALVSLLLVVVTFVGISLLASYKLRNEGINAAMRQSKAYLEQIVQRQTAILRSQLDNISQSARIFASAAQRALTTPLKAGEISIEESKRYAYTQGDTAYYAPLDNGGCAIFYSGIVPVGEKERDKVLRTARLDPLMRDLHHNNPLIAQLYLNTFDSLERIYPFVNVLEQYSPKQDVLTFNVYYEADTQHNPKRNVVWTDGYRDPAGRGWMVSSIAPVYNGDFLEGVVGLDVSMATLSKGILALQSPWEGFSLLVGKQGAILARPPVGEQALGLNVLNPRPDAAITSPDLFKADEFNIYQQADFSKLGAALQSQARGVEEITLNTSPNLVAWDTVPETQWKLLVVVSAAKLYAPAVEFNQRLNWLSLWIFIGFILFYIVFFWVLYGYTRQMSAFLVGPLGQISALVKRIAVGDYNFSPPRFPIQELDDSAHALAMVGQRWGESHGVLLEAQERLI
jgi:hypothetical protein